MKRKPKSERKKLIVECKLLWSKLVKIRDKNECRVCGSDAGLQSHHIFADRMHSTTRYMVSNGIALCFQHHYPRGHSDPCVMRENIVKAIGQEHYDMLERHSVGSQKYSVHDLTEIRNQFLAMLSKGG